MKVLKQFTGRFNENDEAEPWTQEEISRLEKRFGIKLPEDYKILVATYGDIWTPGIVDIIAENELDMNNVQDFWGFAMIIEEKKDMDKEETSKNLLPFASDALGNVFAFSISDLESSAETAAVYFLDYDFDTVEKTANSFTEWIDGFNKI
jgi:cell wall assembly regulator SMI1